MSFELEVHKEQLGDGIEFIIGIISVRFVFVKGLFHLFDSTFKTFV